MMDLDEDDVDEGDEDADADLTQHAMVSCPYCGESVEVSVDQGGGGVQEYVEDCQVCCRPWSVRVAVDVDGHPTVSDHLEEQRLTAWLKRAIEPRRTDDDDLDLPLALERFECAFHPHLRVAVLHVRVVR